jgi:tRNA G10  N-methylase Trm11
MANRARRVGIATVLITVLGLSSFPSAFADDDHSNNKPHSKMEFKNSTDKFKFEINSYKAAISARKVARDQINANFKAAIKKANRQATAALVKATTPEQKLIIMNNLKNARTAAVALRDAALAALGSLPTPPVEPKNDDKRRTLAP